MSELQNIFNHFPRGGIHKAVFLRFNQYSVNLLFYIFIVTPEKKLGKYFRDIQKLCSLNYKPRRFSGLIWLRSFASMTELIIFKLFSFSHGKYAFTGK
jgi:hypothetical protein